MLNLPLDIEKEALNLFVNPSILPIETKPIIPKHKSDRVCKFSIKNMTIAHKKSCRFQHVSLCPNGTTCTNPKCNEYHTDSNGKNDCFGYNNCKYFTNCKNVECNYCHPYIWYEKYPLVVKKWEEIMVLRNKINNEAKK